MTCHAILSVDSVCWVASVELDLVDCGIDHALDVTEGDVEILQYPWLGILYYTFCKIF